MPREEFPGRGVLRLQFGLAGHARVHGPADPDLAVGIAGDVHPPGRPRTVPWLAAYGALTRPLSSSHWASEAFRLPVTGSSMVGPPPG